MLVLDDDLHHAFGGMDNRDALDACGADGVGDDATGSSDHSTMSILLATELTMMAWTRVLHGRRRRPPDRRRAPRIHGHLGPVAGSRRAPR